MGGSVLKVKLPDGSIVDIPGFVGPPGKDGVPFNVNISIKSDESITADKTFEEIKLAYNKGMIVRGICEASIFTLCTASDVVFGFFGLLNGDICLMFCYASNAWGSTVIDVATTEYVDDCVDDMEKYVDNISKTKLDTEAGEDNNGKFLRVVDGKATWVALQNAEEVAF